MYNRFALMILFLSGLALLDQSKPVLIDGSETMILFGQRCAGLYKKEAPVEITVHGGVIANAFKSLTDRKVDIVQSDKPVAGHTGIAIGVHSIVVYVNNANPVSELSMIQLKGIYLGKIKNWKEVGGADQPISLFAGESTSGILNFFQELVLSGDEPYPFWGKSTPKELIETVAADKNAIGYTNFTETKQVKRLKIKGANAIAVEPTLESIRSLKYPIARNVYWYVASSTSGPAQSFALWVLSPRGQLVVESIGYEPLNTEDRQKATQALAKIFAGGGMKSGN